ncbi:LPS translocon maturation chaperone LptM [Rubrivivax albus]
MRRASSLVACLLTLGLLQGLSGCGQKGPLTLPPAATAASAAGAAR